MTMKKQQTDAEITLEFCAKILSWGLEKDFVPEDVYMAYQAHLLTKLPFKQCVEAARQARKEFKLK